MNDVYNVRDIVAPSVGLIPITHRSFFSSIHETIELARGTAARGALCRGRGLPGEAAKWGKVIKSLNLKIE